ncbi:MAG: hypothetical protein U5K31_05640 [Balneolaceae bacterium]|nr:hypothetical protein [Balneolaceae bacterium]
MGFKFSKTEYDNKDYIAAHRNFNRVSYYDNKVTFIDPYVPIESGTHIFGGLYKIIEVDPSFQVSGLNYKKPKKIYKRGKTSKGNQNQYLFLFDVETNGLPQKWDANVEDIDNWPRLVQLAWILCNSEGEIIYQKDSIVKPDGFKVSHESTMPWHK